MDADLKERWLEALRSGRYPQDKRYLRTRRGYCPLGVLADVIDPHRWNLDPSDDYRWGLAHGYLWSEAADSTVGLRMATQRCLSVINDYADDFGPSIDYIEKEL